MSLLRMQAKAAGGNGLCANSHTAKRYVRLRFHGFGGRVRLAHREYGRFGAPAHRQRAIQLVKCNRAPLEPLAASKQAQFTNCAA